MKPKRWVDKANVAIEGIIYSVKTQRHMQYHLVSALAVILLSLAVNISRIEFIVLCLAVILVIATEMLNTAIETAIDMISEEYHPKARIAKDIGAGVVLVASIGAAILAYLILYPPLRTLLTSGGWQLQRASGDIVALASLVAVIIIVVFIKALVGKGEPLRGGMPSGHAAVAFSLWVTVVNLSGSLLVTGIALVPAVMVSWNRWSSGVHRPLEVIAGALLGAGVTLLLFFLFT
jgi:diacylglycerol kinase (ATP)